MAALVGVVWLFASFPFLFGIVQCPTARLFHVACPGCGMTRAFHLLADGHLQGSLEMHALALPTALSQLVLAATSILATLRFGTPWALVRTRWGHVALVVVALVMVLDVLLWAARALGALGGPVPV